MYMLISGNRWIQSMWVVTPHKNPPLDLSELKPNTQIVEIQYPDSHLYYPTSEIRDEEAHYPESELGTLQPQEYMELHKRESDI